MTSDRINDNGTLRVGFLVSLIAYVLDSKPKNAYITIEEPLMTPSKPFVYGVLVKLSNLPNTKPATVMVNNKTKLAIAIVLLNKVVNVRPRKAIA
jgi:hypothetical protein